MKAYSSIPLLHSDADSERVATGILVILLGILAVIGWQQANQVRSEVVYVPVEKTVYVDRAVYQPLETITIEKIVYQDRIIEKPVPQVFSDWQSLEELTQFLKDDPTDKAIFYSLIPGEGFGKPFVDCDDYALILRDNTAKVGKYIGLQRITVTEFIALTGRPWVGNPNDVDMLNNAVVNGRFYYISAQTDEIWVKESLD